MAAVNGGEPLGDEDSIAGMVAGLVSTIAEQYGTGQPLAVPRDKPQES
tara:strand:+ start:2831 stop:2974 length:144 start_codon:yes stop_codon:yes gene_type:complete